MMKAMSKMRIISFETMTVQMLRKEKGSRAIITGIEGDFVSVLVNLVLSI